MGKIRPLAPELAAVARIQLNEFDTQTTLHNVKILRKWILSNPTLEARIDDQFLVAFLRYCKHDVEVAKQRIEYYYTFKSTSADSLRFVVDDKLMRICQSGIFAALPHRADAAGPSIHLSRLNLIDSSVFSVYDLFRYHTMRAEIELNIDDNWIVCGVLEIVDCSKIPFGFLRQFDSGTFKKMSAFLEHGVPTYLRGTHIINASKEVQLVLSIVRSLMKQKELLHIHNNLASLHKAIGKNNLPVEYGGCNGTLSEAIARQTEELLRFRPYFEEEPLYGLKVECNCPAAANYGYHSTTAAEHGKKYTWKKK